jgi:cardiolipin synthase
MMMRKTVLKEAGTIKRARPASVLTGFHKFLLISLLILNSCSWPILRNIPLIGETYESPKWENREPVKSPEFKTTLERVLGATFTNNNLITTFVNGDEIFPAMLNEIRKAQESIYLESYILWDGRLAKELVAAISERAKAGVRCRLIFDWHGSQGSEKYIKELKKAGAEVALYHPLSWYNPFRWKDIGNLDNRTHRRILVIDGKTAFTGGAAFADEWLGNARNENEWRDTHFKIEGSAVHYLAGIFSENWWASKKPFSFDPEPPLTARGNSSVEIVKSTPGVAIPADVISFSLAIEGAESSISIATPYFVPEDELLHQLAAAAKRGVKIDLIVPGKTSDKAIVRTASRGLWGALLKAGIKIYEFQPSLYHCKVLVVDNMFVSFGTANWDSRSLRLNDEIIVNVLDRDFAIQQTKILEGDKAQSKLITYQDWKTRPFWERFFDSISGATREEL